MGNYVQELIQMLVISAVINALLVGILLWIYSWSRPVFTHFVAKLTKQPLLLVFREDGRWGLVRVKLKHGFVQHKYYGDFIAVPDAFRPLAGVPLAVAYSKVGFTLPPEFVAKTTVLKTLKKKLSDVVKLRKVNNGPGYEVEKVENVKVLASDIDEKTRHLLKVAGAQEYEEELATPAGTFKVRGFLLNVKDTFEYLLFSLNPINLRARINARIAEEIAARGKADALKTAFAVFMVVVGIAFALAILEIVFGGSGTNVAQQVQQQIKDVIPISISQGVKP